MRKLLLTVGMQRFNLPIPGDDVSIAERVLDIYMRPKIALYDANDDAKAERTQIGMPSPQEWLGVTFQLQQDAEYSARRFPTFEVHDTRCTAKGRVKDLLVRDTRPDRHDPQQRFWCRIRPHGSGWLLAFPRWTPLPIGEIGSHDRHWVYWIDHGWDYPVIRIARFPRLKIHYTPTIFCG